MSRNTRGNDRRRTTLMATTSLVASTLIAGLGGAALNALAPSVAQAVIVCLPGNPGPNDYVCTGADTGLLAILPVDYTVDLKAVTTTTFGATVFQVGPANDVGVASDGATSITSTVGDAFTITNFGTGDITTVTPSGSDIDG